MRDTSVIQTAILNDVAADATLNTKMTSLNVNALWKRIVAVISKCINAFEGVLYGYVSTNEGIISGSVIGSNEWYRQRALEFQYGDDLNFNSDNYYAFYDTVSASKRIITFCTVSNQYKLNALAPGNGITITAATGSVPTALSADQLAQLTDYIASITPTGTEVTVGTGAADYLGIYCDVRFDSRYSASIQNTVLTAIRNYIQNLPENLLVVDSLLKVIEDIEGVRYITITKVTARDSAATVPIILFSMVNAVLVPYSAIQSWETKFGYMVEETAASQTWSDTITFTPETL